MFTGRNQSFGVKRFHPGVNDLTFEWFVNDQLVWEGGPEFNYTPDASDEGSQKLKVVLSTDSAAESITFEWDLLVIRGDEGFGDAFDGGDNRKYLDWFGWYNDEYWPWIWDYEFGVWLWVVDNGPENVWFWHDVKQNWMWARTDWYRWVWFPGSPGLTWRTE